MKMSAQEGSLWPRDCKRCCGPCPIRYRLHFERDSREEVERRKRAAREQVLQPVSAELLELDIREVYQPGSGESSTSGCLEEAVDWGKELGRGRFDCEG